MGGGAVRTMNLRVWGTDLVEEHLLSAVGIPSCPLLSKKAMVCIGEHRINADKTGKMKNNTWLSKWEKHPSILYLNYMSKTSDSVIGSGDGLPTHIAEVACVKGSTQEAIDFIDEIVKSVEGKIPIG